MKFISKRRPIYIYQDLLLHLQRINDYLREQNKRIQKMEKVMMELQQELNGLKQRPTTTIEKIEYKFDQLKVETLEGTLNIGLNPVGNEAIEEFDVKQNQLDASVIKGSDSKLFRSIQEHIHEYINSHSASIVKTYEEKNNYQLEESHRQFIIESVKKQIDERIRLYLKHINTNILRKDQENDIEQTTIKKVKQDIHNTFEGFVLHLTKGE